MPEKLWCVEVVFEETVIPQPSREVADKRAKQWATEYAELLRLIGIAPKKGEQFKVTGWPWSAEAHAEELAKHGGEPEDFS